MIVPSPILIIGLAASVALLAVGLGRRTATSRLNQRIAHFVRTSDAVVLRASGWVRFAETFLVTSSQDRQEIRQALRQAAFNGANAFGWFAAARLGAALLCAGIAAIALAYAAIPGAGRAFAIFAAFAIPFLASKRVLWFFAHRRVGQVLKELPFLIDMLVLMLESGVSLDQALRQFAQMKMTGMEHTRRATVVLVDDLQKGMDYDQALARWSDRLAANGVRELAGLIAQSVTHGTELGPMLRDYSREMADRRLSTAREAVGRKATQMTMVMVVCLLPALMIILAGPAVSTIDHVLVHHVFVQKREALMRTAQRANLAASLLIGGLLLAGCSNTTTTQRFNPGESALPKAAALDQSHARKLYLLVVDGMRKDGQARAALAYLNDYDRIYPNDPQADLLRADCLLSTGQPDKAEPLYQGLISGPYAAAANAGLGQVAAAHKQWPEAVSRFQAALNLDPAHATYANDLGFAQLQVGDYAGAVDTLSQAQQLDPTDPLMRNNLILGLHLAGRDAEARQMVQGITDPAQKREAEHLLHVSAATIDGTQNVKLAANQGITATPEKGTRP